MLKWGHFQKFLIFDSVFLKEKNLKHNGFIPDLMEAIPPLHDNDTK